MIKGKVVLILGTAALLSLPTGHAQDLSLSPSDPGNGLQFYSAGGVPADAGLTSKAAVLGRRPSIAFRGDGLVLRHPRSESTTPMLIEHDVTVGSMVSDRFTWQDSSNQPRVAVLAHNDGQTGPGGTRGGELREFRYEVGGLTRIVAASSSAASGFGYVVSHPDASEACIAGPDSSSLGHFLTGTFTRVFEGQNHAIFRFTQNYPRYCSKGGPPLAAINLPVTIDWVFATGRDSPLWALTWDLSGVAVNTLMDDSRAPYGELLFDGAATEAAVSTIAGVAWGDGYKFFSTTNPVTMNSAWTWNTANTVPYVKLWTTAVDATMGTVQTQTITQQDAGGYWGTNRWNTTSAAGNACTAPVQLMPCDYNWPYQSINYSFVDANTPTNNTRLAWGTNFGFLGQMQYYTQGSAFYGGPLPNTTAPGWPKKSYSAHIVFGTHSTSPVEAEVAQVETVQSLTLTAMTGSVVTSGPAGVGRADTVTYSPPGYNHVYGALAFQASGNSLDANIQVSPVTVFNVTSPGYYYTFSGISGQNPPLTLVAGTTYTFNINTASIHPFEILDAPPGSVTNNNIYSGTITFTVPNAGGTFRYHCSIHNFGNTITTRAAGAGMLKKPLLIVGNYTGSDPIVQLGGTTLVAGTDYFHSLRPAANELWITFNSDFSGATNHIHIQAPPPPAAPTGVAADAVTSTRVDINWPVVLNATSYQIDRMGPNGGAFAQIGTSMTNSFSDTSAAAGSAYLYRVRSVNAAGTSANSSPDLATTVIFTDSSLTAGTTVVKAVHLAELRTAVNAVRLLASLAAANFTDAATAGVTIKAIHVTELRSALDAARMNLSLSTGGYTDGSLAGVPVKAVHFQELRNRVQ